MAKSTQEELIGVSNGAIGVPGPLATQGGLDKIRKTTAYASLAAAAADLVAGEVMVAEISNVPNLVVKNAAGTGYKVALTTI